MPHAFGSNFVIVNDVQQVLDPKIFSHGPWVHLVTVVRGFKEYCAFRHLNSNRTYIEEVDTTVPGLFVQIQDNEEWNDLYAFLTESGSLTISGKDKELKGGKLGLPGFFYGNQHGQV